MGRRPEHLNGMSMLSLSDFMAVDAAYKGVNTPEKAFAITCALAGRLGFEHVIHAPVRNHPQASRNWAATTYPRAWQEIYVSKGYLSRNPVRHRVIETSRPFFWSDLEARLAPGDREIFHECRATGMKEGFVVPVHGPR
jgi:hypothetical protein